MELKKIRISKSVLWKSVPVLIGALAGFLYYKFVGCVSGACPITSHLWTSAGYGALLGLLLVQYKSNKK